MRRLLIFSADFTGHGHKSIANSLTERLAVYDDLEVRIIDGFDLMSKVQKACFENTYGPITRLPSGAWAMGYAAGMKFKMPLQRTVAKFIRKNFEKLMYEYKPDCILTVHPFFVGSILDLLDELNLKIPMMAHEADLIDIALQWFEPRLTMTFAPSKESYDCTVAHGIDPAKVCQVGFPVRSRFMGLAEKASKVKNKHTTVTIMSGSEGAGIVRVIARELLRKTDCDVNVICGSNERLRKKIRNSLGKQYHGRINPMGFVDNIQDVMCASDILIMRASPNSVMEAVALNKPVILFGQLAGQELHNPDMLQSHGLAAYCPDPERLPDCIAELSRNNNEGIEKMRAAQRAYAPGDVTAETAKILNEMIVPYWK